VAKKAEHCDRLRVVFCVKSPCAKLCETTCDDGCGPRLALVNLMAVVHDENLGIALHAIPTQLGERLSKQEILYEAGYQDAKQRFVEYNTLVQEATCKGLRNMHQALLRTDVQTIHDGRKKERLQQHLH
jgi:hypothetical protein